MVVNTPPDPSTASGVSSHLGHPTRPLHVDPEPLSVEDDPAAWSLSVDVLLGGGIPDTHFSLLEQGRGFQIPSLLLEHNTKRAVPDRKQNRGA